MDETKDNEYVGGNILNALLVFPTDYTFHVVGKTGADVKLQESFFEAAKSALMSLVDEPIRCDVTPRGKSFTKVSMTANVPSAEVIASVYVKLEALPLSVMQF
jgi:putative lipoic acid-binding regulatory protein